MLFGSITGIYLVVASVVTISLLAADSPIVRSIRETVNPTSQPVEDDRQTGGESASSDEPAPTVAPPDDDGFLRPPSRTFFLIIGLDQDRLLTDVLIAGCFYRDAAEIHLMSIPRDLFTRIPGHRLAEMRAEGRTPPSYMKINELRSYGGRTNGTRYLVEQLGEMLGIGFHFYAEISIPAFRNIVDAIGGVTMEIPNINNGGIYYNDPYQNLHIALEAGMQDLDGEKAEQLIRFRNYPGGDVGRNAVHMEFMKQLMRQAMRREAIMNDPLALFNAVRNDIETNLGIEVFNYIRYVSQLSGDRIFTYTMPGTGDYGEDGISYFFPDTRALPAAVQDVFFAHESDLQAVPTDAEPPQPPVLPGAGVRVQVLNGSRVAGLASSFADTLAFDGYIIDHVDTFTGSKESATRIRIINPEIGTSLRPYFQNAQVNAVDSLPEGVDAVIIVGTGEG